MCCIPLRTLATSLYLPSSSDSARRASSRDSTRCWILRVGGGVALRDVVGGILCRLLVQLLLLGLELGGDAGDLCGVVR